MLSTGTAVYNPKVVIFPPGHPHHPQRLTQPLTVATVAAIQQQQRAAVLNGSIVAASTSGMMVGNALQQAGLTVVNETAAATVIATTNTTNTPPIINNTMANMTTGMRGDIAVTCGSSNLTAIPPTCGDMIVMSTATAPVMSTGPLLQHHVNNSKHQQQVVNHSKQHAGQKDINHNLQKTTSSPACHSPKERGKPLLPITHIK